MTPCTICAHLTEGKNAPNGHPRSKAFPEGIPWPIWYGQIEHDKPVPGDGGVVFRHVADDALGEPGDDLMTRACVEYKGIP